MTVLSLLPLGVDGVSFSSDSDVLLCWGGGQVVGMSQHKGTSLIRKQGCLSQKKTRVPLSSEIKGTSLIRNQGYLSHEKTRVPLVSENKGTYLLRNVQVVAMSQHKGSSLTRKRGYLRYKKHTGCGDVAAQVRDDGTL